jgi:hypothetical protein
MMTKRIVLSLIVVTTLTFSLAYAAIQQYLIAVLALVTGLIWLKLEYGQEHPFAAMFFLFFLGLAVLGSLSDLSPLVTLFGICADLAAWDLSRFQARATYARTREIEPPLETRHFQRLFAALGIGLLIALLPTVVRLSTSFVLFSVLTLLLMFVLRASVLHLRQDKEHTG